MTHRLLLLSLRIPGDHDFTADVPVSRIEFVSGVQQCLKVFFWAVGDVRNVAAAGSARDVLGLARTWRSTPTRTNARTAMAPGSVRPVAMTAESSRLDCRSSRRRLTPLSRRRRLVQSPLSGANLPNGHRPLLSVLFLSCAALIEHKTKPAIRSAQPPWEKRVATTGRSVTAT